MFPNDEDKQTILRKFAQRLSLKIYTSPPGTAMIRILKKDVQKYDIPKDAELTGRVFSIPELKQMIDNKILYDGIYLVIQTSGVGPEILIKNEGKPLKEVKVHG